MLDRELDIIGWLRCLANECIYACNLLVWSEGLNPIEKTEIQSEEAEEKGDLTSLLMIPRGVVVEQWST